MRYNKRALEIKTLRGVTQFGRVLGFGPRCRRFNSCHLDHKNTDTVWYPYFFISNNRVTGVEGVRERLCRWQMKGVRGEELQQGVRGVHLYTTLNDHVVLGVKKTVQWTVFREGVDASFLSYLCLISEVGSSARRKYVTDKVSRNL